MGVLAIAFLNAKSKDLELSIVLSQITKLKRKQGHISQDKELIYHKKTTS